jgi:hypothetical protein
MVGNASNKFFKFLCPWYPKAILVFMVLVKLFGAMVSKKKIGQFISHCVHKRGCQTFAILCA